MARILLFSLLATLALSSCEKPAQPLPPALATELTRIQQVAAHYLNTKDKPDAASDPFIKNTNQLAQSDPALNFLLGGPLPNNQ